MIDAIGYVQQSREEMKVLFTLLAERYERGSVIVADQSFEPGTMLVFEPRLHRLRLVAESVAWQRKLVTRLKDCAALTTKPIRSS